jgi:hypothetical protein
MDGYEARCRVLEARKKEVLEAAKTGADPLEDLKTVYVALQAEIEVGLYVLCVYIYFFLVLRDLFCVGVVVLCLALLVHSLLANRFHSRRTSVRSWTK